LRKQQSLRVFEDTTAVAVAEAVVGDLGLRVEADGDPGRLGRVVQHRQTDLELLVEVAARAGLLVTLDGGTLRLVTLAGYGEPVSLHYRRSLFRATVEANVDRVAQSVTAYGWQHQRAELIEAAADSPRNAPDVPLTIPPGQSLSLVDQAAEDTADLAGLAQHALDTATARSVVLRGVAAGDARLRAGTRLRVSGLADEVDGGYVICTAVHTIDGDGYQTTFSTEPPPAPPRQAGATVSLGRVTAVDDPDGLGRVRVSLPAFGDLDVGWLGVLCPGAGSGRGLLALPDVDDTVAVALPHGAPEEGLVLGALFGTIAPPDPGVAGGAVVRWSLRTKDGQSIVVDDDKHSLKVEDRAGSFVELAPGTVKVHADADLVLEAPGGGITIRARSVDFEQAVI
jgi:phage baseplate assembly protein gpV